jgi:hypothetical protein
MIFHRVPEMHCCCGFYQWTLHETNPPQLPLHLPVLLMTELHSVPNSIAWNLNLSSFGRTGISFQFTLSLCVIRHGATGRQFRRMKACADCRAAVRVRGCPPPSPYHLRGSRRQRSPEPSRSCLRRKMALIMSLSRFFMWVARPVPL